tara:strand:+ start:47 stop:499 length:453 start_codon:yes stop_codon:yes gene_type:complete
MSTFNGLDETFNTEKTEELPAISEDAEENLPVVAGESSPDQELEDDYQSARKSLQDADKYTKEAIDGIMRIAKNSDAPRAYEVAGQLIKTLQDNANSMMEVQEKKKKVSGVTPTTPGSVTNNTIVATTEDLLRMLNNKGEIVIDHEQQNK